MYAMDVRLCKVEIKHVKKNRQNIDKVNIH